LREIVEKLAKRRLKGYKWVFASEADRKRYWERQNIHYDVDVEKYDFACSIVKNCALRAEVDQLINPATREIRGISPHRLRNALLLKPLCLIVLAMV